MPTFPAHLGSSDGEQRTDLICPNCGGAIRVRAEGSRGALAFECMVGHLYTLDAFLMGKEEHIEDAMWAALYAYQEMASFLSDLAARAPHAPFRSAPRHLLLCCHPSPRRPGVS